MAKTQSKGYTPARKSGKRSYMFVAVVLLAACLIILMAVLSKNAAGKRKDFLNQHVSIDVQSFESEGREHTPDKVTYKTFPPTSGAQFVTPAAYGFYKEAPAFEYLVHSLEHGDIVIYYKPGLGDKDMQSQRKLSAITYQGSGVEVVPNGDIDTPVVATAWTKMMKLPSVDEAKLKQFMYRFMYEGPEKLAHHS